MISPNANVLDGAAVPLHPVAEPFLGQPADPHAIFGPPPGMGLPAMLPPAAGQAGAPPAQLFQGAPAPPNLPLPPAAPGVPIFGPFLAAVTSAQQPQLLSRLGCALCAGSCVLWSWLVVGYVGAVASHENQN